MLKWDSRGSDTLIKYYLHELNSKLILLDWGGSIQWGEPALVPSLLHQRFRLASLYCALKLATLQQNAEAFAWKLKTVHTLCGVQVCEYIDQHASTSSLPQAEMWHNIRVIRVIASLHVPQQHTIASLSWASSGPVGFTRLCHVMSLAIGHRRPCDLWLMTYRIHTVHFYMQETHTIGIGCFLVSGDSSRRISAILFLSMCEVLASERAACTEYRTEKVGTRWELQIDHTFRWSKGIQQGMCTHTVSLPRHTFLFAHFALLTQVLISAQPFLFEMWWLLLWNSNQI